MELDTERITWTRGPLIGAGAFGTVNMGLNCESGALFAVKSVEVDVFPERLIALEKEIEVLSTIDSPRVVNYIGTDWTVEDGVRRRNLLIEFVPGGSISDLTKNFGGKLQESLIRKYTRDILEGLRDLHEAGIVHGDIKGKNILVGSTGAKLCDFGAAEYIDSAGFSERANYIPSLESPSSRPSSLPAPMPPILAAILHQEGFRSRPTSPRVLSPSSGRTSPRTGTSKLRGTVCWMAPEVLQTPHSSGTAADIWSLGCTVIEMATGDSPWGNKIADSCSALYRIGLSQSIPEFPKDMSPECHDFLSKCLQRDPELRQSAEELLRHPFVCQPYTASEAMDKESAFQISPTSVLQIGSEWDVIEPRLPPKLPLQIRKHRRSVSDVSAFALNLKLEREDSGKFPSLAKLALASSGGTDALKPVKNPAKVKKLQRTQTAEETILENYWQEDSSSMAQGNWIAVHSPCATPGTLSVTELSPNEEKSHLSWRESCEDMVCTCGGSQCATEHQNLTEEELEGQRAMLCPSLTFGQMQ